MLHKAPQNSGGNFRALYSVSSTCQLLPNMIPKYLFVTAVIFLSIGETISYVLAYKTKGFISFSLTGMSKCQTDLIKTFGMT